MHSGRAVCFPVPLGGRRGNNRAHAGRIAACLRVSGGAVNKRRRSLRASLSPGLGSPARSAKARCAGRRRVKATCAAAASSAAATAASPPRARLHADAKVQLRRILRSVHPDKYTQDPQAHETNSVSLQRLNAYVDALEAGARSRCTPQSLRFLVRDDTTGALREVTCTLPPGGSLAPLFSAFSGVNAAGARHGQQPGGRGHVSPGVATGGEPLVEWLKSNIGESVTRRQQHEGRATQLASAKSALQKEFGLRHLHLGFLAESATASAAHLVAVGEALRCLSHEACAALRDVHILVADPQEIPQASRAGGVDADADAAAAGKRGGACILAPDGTLWIPLSRDWRPLWRFLRSCDLAAAAAAGQATAQAAADVQSQLLDVASRLGVKYVFAPSALLPEPVGRFVRGILHHAGPARERPRDAAFRFGIHVCADMPPGPWDITWTDPQHAHPLVAYARGQRSVMAHVDCPPGALVRFLATHGAACDAHRAAGEGLRAHLDKAQAGVLATLGAALHASVMLPDVAALAAADKLLAAASQITDAVGVDRLRGTRIMLVCDADPCSYEVLPNGTLCIPASFQVDLLVRAILGTVATSAR